MSVELYLKNITKSFVKDGVTFNAVQNVDLDVKGGELVTFLASVNYTGRTSMEVGIKVITEDIRNRAVRHTNSCFFTMVAMDEDGRSTPVPPREP